MQLIDKTSICISQRSSIVIQMKILADGVILSSMAGLFAAMAAVFSKFAFDSDYLSDVEPPHLGVAGCVIMVIICNVLKRTFGKFLIKTKCP